LDGQHINKIYSAYKNFKKKEGFCTVLKIEELLKKDGSLNIAQYVSNVEKNLGKIMTLHEAVSKWNDSSKKLKKSVNELFKIIN